MKLIPFDLEKALSNDYKIITRSNDEVLEIFTFNSKDLEYPIVAVINKTEGGGKCLRIFNYCIRGRYFSDKGVDSPDDLFLIKNTKIHYVSVLKRDTGSFYVCDTRLSLEECESNEKDFDKDYTLHTRLTFEG